MTKFTNYVLLTPAHLSSSDKACQNRDQASYRRYSYQVMGFFSGPAFRWPVTEVVYFLLEVRKEKLSAGCAWDVTRNPH